MTQYLVTTFKDSTGRKHTHITKAKSNQRFTVVEAESKEEAKEKYEKQVKRDAVIKVGQLFEKYKGVWEMIKKLKNMDGFDIFIVGILSLFGITALLLVVALPIYTVASYQNKEVHQGTITDKYNKRQDKEDKFYIVLDDKQVIEN